jgi:hypothetical protein
MVILFRRLAGISLSTIALLALLAIASPATHAAPLSWGLGGAPLPHGGKFHTVSHGFIRWIVLGEYEIEYEEASDTALLAAGASTKNVGGGTEEITFLKAKVVGFPSCSIKSRGGTAGTVGPVKGNLELVWTGEHKEKTTTGAVLLSGIEEFEKEKEVITVIELSGTCPKIGTLLPVTGTLALELGKFEKEGEKGIFEKGKAGEEFLVGALNAPKTAILEVFKWNSAGAGKYLKVPAGLKLGEQNLTVDGGEAQLVVNTKGVKTGEKFGFIGE